jgi:hypothetical protein
MSRFSRSAAMLMAGSLLALAAASQAKPEYARKEKKQCGYCHTNPAGGGARNARGVFYAMHNHTFEGYDEAKVMGTAGETAKKGGTPAFKSAWKVEVPAATKRIAVGDVVGDKVTRLLVLDDHNKLTVLNVAGDMPKEEATADLGDQGSKFVVGNFAKGKPAVVAVPGAIFYRDGDSVKKKAVADLTDITGFVKFTDGTENFFFFGGGGQPDVYALDVNADKPLIAGREMVDPASGGGVYSNLVAHLPAEILGALGLPEQGQKSGIIGMFDPRNEGKLYVWVPWADNGDNTLKVTAIDGLSHDGNSEFKPLWSSPKLAGKVLDASYGVDPRNAKQSGLFVLMATGEGGKGRTVEFFALD